MSSKMISERTRRVLHGGSWILYGGSCRSADRLALLPNYRDSDYGLRLVAKAEPQPKLLRSGAWYTDSRICRSAYRGAFPPGYCDSHSGFRLVASISVQERTHE